MSTRRSLPALLLAAIAFVAGCHKGAPAGVAATVNNHSITFADLEKNYKMQPMANPEGISADEIQIQKLDLLGKMIEAEIMLQLRGGNGQADAIKIIDQHPRGEKNADGPSALRNIAHGLCHSAYVPPAGLCRALCRGQNRLWS